MHHRFRSLVEKKVGAIFITTDGKIKQMSENVPQNAKSGGLTEKKRSRIRIFVDQ